MGLYEFIVNIYFGRRRPSGGLLHGIPLKTENMGIKEPISGNNTNAEQQICVHDETIKRLLVGAKGKYKKRLLPLFRSLDKEQADRDLAELKSLEGRRFALLSESSLKKDWLRPEEDEAWREL